MWHVLTITRLLFTFTRLPCIEMFALKIEWHTNPSIRSHGNNVHLASFCSGQVQLCQVRARGRSLGAPTHEPDTT